MEDSIVIYKQEQLDGLTDKLKNNSISFASLINTDKDLISNIPDIKLAIASANQNQRDLYYRYAILASVGWNKNDDVFDAVETWNAKNSPTDKQLNYNHDDSFIIGHMTEDFVLDAEGKIIEPTDDKIPDKFDVGVGFVIYTTLEDEERNKTVAEIIDGIEKNEWFVSMECRFPDFDYAVCDADGNQKTVARSKETSFLTKHLRAYGGSGEYQGHKVGRLLKNYFFSGIGIVKKPANSRSIIFDTKDVKEFKSQGSINIKDTTKMEEDFKRLKAELDVAMQEVAALKKAKVETDEEKMKNDKSKATEMDSKITELSAAKAALEAELAKAKENLEKKSSEFNEIVAKATETKEALDKAEAKMLKIERVGKLTSAGVTQEAAESIYEQFSTVTEAQFDALVKVHSTKAKDVTSVTETVTTDFSKAEVEQNVTNTQPVNDQETQSAKASQRVSTLRAFVSQAIGNTKGDK